MLSLKRIIQLIEEDRLDLFYTSRSWRACRAEAFERCHYECQECKRNGKLTLLRHPDRELRDGEVEGIGHHKLSLKEHPELALDPKNIEAVCWSCHNVIEHRDSSFIVSEEIW